MIHILAELAPLKVSDGSRPVLRASSAQDRALNGVASQKWWPAISKRPALAIPLFDGDFTQDVEAATASFTVRLDGLVNLDSDARGYRWAGAPVSIYAIDTSTALNAAGSYDVASLDSVRAFKGRVEGFNLVSNALTITAEIDKEPFEKDVLALTYAGTGDAEGGQDLKGRLKPWIFGRALNVEPILVNSVDSVVQFSAYPVQGISALYERGASFGPSIGNYPTYAALVAANIPAGKWATCHALGMARLGAPPYGVITGDVDGDNTSGFLRRTGAIIQRVATARGVAAALIDTASLNALDAAVPYDINLVLTEQISVLDLARRLARPCNAQAGLDFQGRLFAVRPTIATPALTLDAQGRQLPPVRQCQEAEVSAPYKRIMFGANRSWRVHTFDEIAFDAELIDRGDYDPSKTYRRGNIVSLPNGSRWLYVNDTPKAGSMPSETNTDWELMTGAITAGNITYEDGTPVEALKPAEPGATDGMNDEERDEFDQLAADTATAKTNIAAAQAKIAAIESSVSADLSSLNAEVDALQSSLSTAQGNITSLQSSVNASLSALNSDVDALETQAASIAASVSGLNTQVGSINTNVSALTTRIVDAEGDIDSLQSTVASQGAAITANATAITNAQGSLAEYSLRLSSNRRNLLPNGGPEALLRGWTGSAIWAVNTNNSEGAYFLCTPTASGTFVLTSDAIAMEASVALTLGYETRNTGATSYCDIQCYDASGANLMDGGQNAAASGTVWGDRASRAFTLTTPANTASVRVRLVCVATSASDRARIRQVKLEKGTTWSAYSNDASVAQAFTAISSAEANVASLQTTVATQGASITSNATAITALTGRTATLETTVSSQGATIGTLQSAVSTANGNIASLTTRVNVSQTNLLSNGGLENGFSGAITSGSFAWSNAPEWGPIATTSTNGTQIFEFADITSVQVGATYWISCDPLALGASSIYCDLLFLDASGNVLLDGGQNSQAGPFNFSPNDTRRSLIAVSAVAPSGTTKIRPRVVANVVSNQVAGFRRVKVETGNSWTPFSSEASLFSNWSATNTATASVASLTTTVSTQGASISSAQTAITTLQGSVSSLQTTVSTQGASITSLQSTTSTHTGQIAQHTTDIATANSNISANAQAITTANGNIASLTTRVSSAESSISSQATAITGLTGRTATLETTVSSQGASITSLQTTTSTTSANLATLTTRVNAASTNLLKYGGFESGATGWVVVGAASWGAVNGFWGPFVNTAGLSNGNAGLQSEQFDASPGQAWTASVDAEFLATAGQMYLQMAFLVSGSWTTVGTVYKTLGAGFTSTADGRLRTTQTAPANTTKVRIQFGVVNVTGVTNCGFRQAKLEVGSVMSPYSNEASVYQTIQTLTSATGSLASLSTTVSTQGSSITSLQSSFTSLNGTVSSLSSTVSAQGTSISTLQSASSTQAGQIASLSTRVNASQANLLRNGGLENGFSGATSTAGFGWFSSPSWGPAASTTTNGTQVFQFADIEAVQVGATYWISCDPLAFGTSSIYCDLLFLNAAGSVILDGPQNSQNGEFNFSGDNTRRGLIAVSAVAPTGTVKIRPRIVANVVGGQVAGFRRVKVETGTSWTPFSSEASVVQSFEAISTLNSSYASLSSTVSTQGATISSQATAISTLQGQQSSLSSTVSAQGALITSLQTTTATLQGNVATLTTRVSASGANILPNGGLENGFNSGISSAGGFQFSASNDWGPIALSYDNGLRIFIFAPVYNPQVGGAYTFSVDPLQFGTSDVYCDIICQDVNGNVLLDGVEHGISGQFNFDNTDTRRGQMACTVSSVPSGTDRLICRVFGTVRDGQPIGFRRAKLENGTVWSRYSAEATAAQQFQTLSTLSTQYASLSSTVATQGVSISTQATAITTIQGNVTTLFGRLYFGVDVGGRLSSMTVNNNGIASSIIFNSDLVRFESPDPGTGALEWKDEAIQMRDGAGKLRIFMGHRA